MNKVSIAAGYLACAASTIRSSFKVCQPRYQPGHRIANKKNYKNRVAHACFYISNLLFIIVGMCI